MKRFILGALFGSFLISIAAYADDVKSMIGRNVDGTFPVYVKEKRLEVDAIVIEGTSYAPVRAIAEAVGLDVGFDIKEGIFLSGPTIQEEVDSKTQNRLNSIEWEVSHYTTQSNALKNGLLFDPNHPKADEWKQTLSEYESLIEQLQQEKEELEKQLQPQP